MRIPLLSELSPSARAAGLVHQEHILTPENLPCDVARATVIGGAATGLGLALSLVSKGISVLFLEDDASSLERAQDYLQRGLGGDPTGLLRFSIDPAEASESDLILDRSLEPIPCKLALLQQLTHYVASDTPILPNLAGAELSAVACALPAPERVLGVQIFTPAQQTRIVELAPHSGTVPRITKRVSGLVSRLGKVPVMAPASGFVSERLNLRLLEAADTLLMDGTTPWEIDEALEDFGYAMGIYEAQDLIGTDVAYGVRQRRPRDPARRYIPIADRAVEEGRLGKKASVGWYRYPGGGGKVIDPLVEDLCREEAWFAGISRREFPPEEIRKRLLLSQINEAAWALSSGVSADDLDRISTQALGLPPQTGGIVFWADQMNAREIAAALTALQTEDPLVWDVAPPLVQAAQTGERLRDLAGWRGGS